MKLSYNIIPCSLVLGIHILRGWLIETPKYITKLLHLGKMYPSINLKNAISILMYWIINKQWRIMNSPSALYVCCMYRGQNVYVTTNLTSLASWNLDSGIYTYFAPVKPKSMQILQLMLYMIFVLHRVHTVYSSFSEISSG